MAVMTVPPGEVDLLHARIQQEARDAQLKAAQRATARNNSVVNANATNIVIRGRASWREPGFHNSQSWLWIPGLRPSGRIPQ